MRRKGGIEMGGEGSGREKGLGRFIGKVSNKVRYGKNNIGSSLDDFLKDEGIYDECVDMAKKQIEKDKKKNNRKIK
jgi:hypothetical protein